MTQLMLTRDGVYRSARPMTVDDIARAAPAALAVEAHESRSDRYQVIPTMTVVDALRRAVGVEVYGATQAKTRIHDKKGHTKHVLRLRRPEDEGKPEAPELVLTNSYDGSSSYRLDLGCYRFVCANGLMVGETWDKARVPHMGTSAVEQMVHDTRRLAGQFDTIRDTVEHFKAIALDPRQARAFGAAAAALRHDPATETVNPESVIRARRQADTASNLWTVYNRAQESITRGGYYKATRDEHGIIQQAKVRPVKGIDENSKLNRALWTLAEEMARIV